MLVCEQGEHTFGGSFRKVVLFEFLRFEYDLYVASLVSRVM
jgi:hypothetical protein